MLESWGSFTGAFVGSIDFDWVPEPILVASQLRGAAAKLENMRPPLEASRALAQANIAEHFDTDSGPDGAGWAPWSENYAPVASARNVGGMGEMTGATRAAATSEGAFRVTGHELFMDTSGIPEQGMIFHFGATRSGSATHSFSEGEVSALARSAGISIERARAGLAREVQESGGANVQPPRPFLGIDEETQLKIIDVFDAWFAEAVSFATNPRTGVVQVRTATGQFGARVA